MEDADTWITQLYISQARQQMQDSPYIDCGGHGHMLALAIDSAILASQAWLSALQHKSRTYTSTASSTVETSYSRFTPPVLQCTARPSLSLAGPSCCASLLSQPRTSFWFSLLDRSAGRAL